MDEMDIINNDQDISLQEVKDTAETALEAVSTLAGHASVSLEKTQQASLNVSSLVDQVEKISGKDQYTEMHKLIMGDASISIQEKIELKKEIDAWQDERTEKAAKTVADLQRENAQNAKVATTSWFEPVCCICGGGALLLLSLTPGGRAFVKGIVKSASQVVA